MRANFSSVTALLELRTKSLSGRMSLVRALATFAVLLASMLSNHAAGVINGIERQAGISSQAAIQPTIIKGPSSQKVSVGSTVTFEVVADGNSLSYRWYFNENSIPGETGSSLVLRDVTGDAAGRYYADVVNAEGGLVRTGDAILEVVVVEQPKITKQPSSQKVDLGKDVTFDVAAEGNSLSYQWYFDSTPIVGETNSTLVLRGVTSSAAGKYNAIVSNGEGGVISTSYARLEVSVTEEPAGAERMQFPDIRPEDLGIKIEIVGNKKVKLSPTGILQPFSYESALYQSKGIDPIKWFLHNSTVVPETVKDGTFTFSEWADTRIWRAVYQTNFSRLNGFVRIPHETPREELKTLVVVLHPWLINSGDSAFSWENSYGIGTVCDRNKFVSYFPRCMSGTFWNGKDGPQATDYNHVMNGIRMCRAMVPTIEKVKVVGYGYGVQTAMGLAQIWPETVDSLLLMCGIEHNSLVAEYAKKVNGGNPVVYNRPIPVVILNSSQEQGNAWGSAIRMKTAAAWFAAANGFTGKPSVNPIRRDYMEWTSGADSTVTDYGENVRVIVTDVPNDANNVFPVILGENGYDILYRRFLKEGKLPGDE